MRRSATALSIAIALTGAACEDGPSQTFSPAPPNAAGIWENSEADAAVVAPGSQGFDAAYPATGKLALCSNDFKRDRWSWMLTQPVRPPRFYAGIDLAGGNLWPGLTISEAETPPALPTADGGGLCQSVPTGAGGGCPSGLGVCDGAYWGNNGEVSFSWNVATHLIDQMVLSLGYTGEFQTNPYPDHTGAAHSYRLQVGDVVRQDGQPFLLDWSSASTVEVQITDIYNAAMATYAIQGAIVFDTSTCTSDTTCTSGEVCQCTHTVDSSGKPTATCAATSTKGQCGDPDCGADAKCLILSGDWIFGIRPLVFYVEGTAGQPQPALSIPTAFYNFFSKSEPFSDLPQRVEIGAVGPEAKGTPTGVPAGKTTVCDQKIGQVFSDFDTNCVQVHGDSTNPNGIDAVNLAKVENGLTHDQEHWTANVLGVNQNFTSLKVAETPSIVVMDNTAPAGGDVAQDFTFDVRASGNVQNDYNVTAAAFDYRGSSLVFIEWARLMLADIARITGQATPKVLGDPTCTGFGATGAPNYETTTGCTGVEGLIVPGAGPVAGLGDFSMDPRRPDLNPASNWDNVIGWYVYGGGSIIKPGDLYGAICIDPLTQTDCDSGVQPEGGFESVSVWQNVLHHVTRVMGGGNVGALPPEMQDARYYFKWFGIAYTKYLKAYANYYNQYCAGNSVTCDNFPSGTVGGGLGPSDVMAEPIDLEQLFFDYTVSPGAGGAQTFDKFEYIDRDFIGQGSGATGDGFALSNQVPWDFAYGCDLAGGNQRYDDWYRRMDREEIAMYSTMLVDKAHTAGQENNVNITNLFGTSILPTNWPSYLCAIGQYSDPTVTGGNECGDAHPPLDTTNPSGAPACSATGTCAGTAVCVAVANSYENGPTAPVCAPACDYTTFSASGCGPTQACVVGVLGATAGCVDMKMDKNGPTPCTDPVTGKGVACAAPSVVAPHPLLWYYPSAWGGSPFAKGHSDITLLASDEQPTIGVAKVTIPNWAPASTACPSCNGPYTVSPVAAAPGNAGAACPVGFTANALNPAFCNAPLMTGAANSTSAPSFTPLVPWLTVGGGQSQNGNDVGFSIPEDGQRVQFLTTGQLDFSGVLETYVVDYVPYTDPGTPTCVAGPCNAGYTCAPASQLCISNDNTIRIEAIEGDDFLGQVFVCQDPQTSDILHVGMYDSASSILTWFANHPGAGNGLAGSAQSSCNVLVSRSPADSVVDRITSLSNGVDIGFGGGQGQGRIVSIVLFDTGLIQQF